MSYLLGLIALDPSNTVDNSQFFVGVAFMYESTYGLSILPLFPLLLDS